MIQIIETQTIHRIYYAVNREVPLSNAECQELLVTNQLIELGQIYVGEQIIGVDDLTEKRFKDICKKNEFENPSILNLDIPEVEEVKGNDVEELAE